MSLRDHCGTLGARTGFTRNNYKVTPGLYCTGAPGADSPVLVTCNYKLSVDALRKELTAIDSWILVVDTRGINVWCAAGKGTFSAEEVSYQVQRARLESIVSHRQLILPQLSAPGVSIRAIKKLCGFRAKFGPIAAADLPAFLKGGTISEKMRSITFSLRERAVLIPLEICMLWKPLFFATLTFFLFSGISPSLYSLSDALSRGGLLVLATFVAILCGAGLTPLLLPWIPVRSFWLKGALLGALGSSLFTIGMTGGPGIAEQFALFLWITGCSSYLAMNFTGSTPFTSLSGVAKEMRPGLIFQMSSTFLAASFWLAAPFV